MKINDSKLYGRVIFGYIIVFFIIACISLTFIYQKIKLEDINNKQYQINLVHNKIFVLPLYVNKLSSLSESVFTWNYRDYLEYQRNRLFTDSILQDIKIHCNGFIQIEQVDSLCNMLEQKEYSLLHIMRTIKSKEKSDSLFFESQIPKKSLKTRTVTRKKKGLAGFFGKTETIQEPYYVIEYSELKKKTNIDHKNYLIQIEMESDSLIMKNKLINNQLSELLCVLDDDIQKNFIEYNKEIINAQKTAFRLFSIIIIIAIILLLLSFFIIRSDFNKEETIKRKLKQVIKENVDLLEMRKQIILTISHDVRGPLGNIHNCADLVSETREKKKREIYLDDIRHSCQHVLHLVNDLMDAYRINDVGSLRNDAPFHLNRFLLRISDEFSRKSVSKGLILYSEHNGSNVTVKGDADKLEQVLDNLLTNAIKFTSKGNVCFHTEYLEGKLLIEIRDTGIGMDEETLKKIFSPFERAAQNVNSEGFGLGLFLTKGLVKVLDGTINVESKLGKGSVFKLEFLLPETDELVDECNSYSESITILPKNVLVVDDDPILLKIVEDMLGRNGITCTTCMNVRDVVTAIRQSDYDMILTDVQMPDIDGFALLKLLRNSDIGNSRTIPVAVMTARGDGNSGIYEKEGFAGCIHKPFNIHALLTFLSTIMSQIKVSQTGDFDFSCLLDSTDDHEHMMSLVIMESRKEIEELKTAIKTTNRESMRKTIHRMMPVWEMLEKEQLLRDFQEKLHDMDISDDVICENAIQIIEWIEKLINETENELKRYENSDS